MSRAYDYRGCNDLIELTEGDVSSVGARTPMPTNGEPSILEEEAGEPEEEEEEEEEELEMMGSTERSRVFVE